MNIRFETCDRRRALEFLRKFYPGRTLSDSGDTAKMLDLVEADVFRIPDPEFHPGGAVYPGNNWDDSKRIEYIRILADGIKGES